MSKRGKIPCAAPVLISPEEKYRSLFDNAGEGIYQSSVSGRILNINPGLARLFGYHSPEEMKRNITSAYRQIFADGNYREKILKEVEARGHAQFEFRFLRKDKSQGWGYTSMHAVRNALGKTVYYEGFFLDITDRKKMEEKLREAHNLLEQRVIERTRKIAKLNRNLAADIAKRKKVEKELKQRSVKLKEFNITLRTLLDQRESDRKALEQQIMTNIDDLILPGIERLKDTALTQEASAIIQSLQENLQNLTSPFLSRIKADARLTFKELHIANFIKKGQTSKEIGALMKLSTSTVNLHRNNIRKKLGLRGEKVSLQSHLLSRL
jgi:PAS domain S-box-containing protein